MNILPFPDKKGDNHNEGYYMILSILGKISYKLPTGDYVLFFCSLFCPPQNAFRFYRTFINSEAIRHGETCPFSSILESCFKSTRRHEANKAIRHDELVKGDIQKILRSSRARA